MKSLLRWMVKEPNKPVEECNFEISYDDSDERADKELKLAQGLVKGYIEVVWIGGGVKALINEEALFDENMGDNCGYLGTIVFIRESIEEDDVYFGSITDEDIRKIKAWTVVHANDIHPGWDMKVLSGEAADEFKRQLNKYQKMQQQEWESF